MSETETDSTPQPARLTIRRSSSLSDVSAPVNNMGLSKLSSDVGSVTSLPGDAAQAQHTSLSVLVRQLFGSAEKPVPTVGIQVVVPSGVVKSSNPIPIPQQQDPLGPTKHDVDNGGFRARISPLIGYFRNSYSDSPGLGNRSSSSSVLSRECKDITDRSNSARNIFRFVDNRDLNSWAPSST